MKKTFITAAFILLTLSVFGQYEYRDSNRIGIVFGMNQFSLNTKNFVSNPEWGWNAGLSMRGNYYNDWDMVYCIQFSENNFKVAANNNSVTNTEVKYTLASAQRTLQLSYRLIENHLSFEFGPLIQVTGKLKTDFDKENYTVSGTTLLVKDIFDVSKFNFYPSVGITAGAKHLRLNISYQYGVNNMLGNLNSKNLGVNFKGHPGILNGNLIVYL